ncbi:MAG: hypothetical protein A3F17_07190 [Gammaproteobacteria bacterium RIFCSPHIGHO2_12_FULL_41_15]|nr:MAG: hypothetical protein A3F17_07190 [Gammaproteobacteria bacterium RIFCSPHIGHO2_12_FULL_41_15]
MARHTVKHKSEVDRLEARITTDKKNLLKQAANISGRTLTDFVVDSAYKAAVCVIQEHQQLHLTVNDRDIFIQALSNPPRPSTQLLKAVKVYKKAFTG